MSYGWIVEDAEGVIEGGEYPSRFSFDQAVRRAKRIGGTVRQLYPGEIEADYRVPLQCSARWSDTHQCWFNEHRGVLHISYDGPYMRAWEEPDKLDRDPRKISATNLLKAVREHDERERASADN